MVRTNEERVEEMHRRMEELEKSRARRRTVIGNTAVYTACLTAAVVLALVIFRLPYRAPAPGTGGMTASIFSDHQALGYVMVALAAFCLGALGTVLCFRLRDRRGEKGDDRKL